MNVYLDSSWLLRALLKQSKLKPLPSHSEVFSSILLMIECRRTLDRHLKRGLITDIIYSETSGQLQNYLKSINLLELTSDILCRAAEPFFLPIGSLDAIHLSTAMQLARESGEKISIATFDDELALTAKAHGIKLI